MDTKTGTKNIKKQPVQQIYLSLPPPPLKEINPKILDNKNEERGVVVIDLFSND